jgi:ABC-type polar amino acid transport system ATPase subunit
VQAVRISKITLKKSSDGIGPFEISPRGNVVVLTGGNGSGKSRLLKMLARYFLSLKSEAEEGQIDLSDLSVEVRNKNGKKMEGEEKKDVVVFNYSHYDAPLLSPTKFSPYVISKARENLARCSFEETALNALLFIQDLAKNYSKISKDQFGHFQDFIQDLFGFELTKNANGDPMLFGLRINDAKLSPGQQYLLRMSVALYCNELEKLEKENKEFMLFLDEPETHLHPKVLWKLIEKLTVKFQFGQIWIATHSLALLSTFNLNDIYYMEKGEIKRLASNSAPLIDGLVGDESKRFRMHQFVVSPDAFACHSFAAECLVDPLIVPYKQGDPQVSMAKEIVVQEGTTDDKLTVVDFGAGEGRFIEGLDGLDELDEPNGKYKGILGKLTYYAYDKNCGCSTTCKSTLEKFGLPRDNYFNDSKALCEVLSKKGGADVVFMISVLHEIPPIEWPETFKKVCDFLGEKGRLVIIENEELTYGEKPYDNGFLVPIESSLKKYSHRCDRHDKRNNIIRFVINKGSLEIDSDNVLEMIKNIEKCALDKIKEIKSTQHNDVEGLNGFKHGIRLAFWVHQYANAGLILREMEQKNQPMTINC